MSGRDLHPEILNFKAFINEHPKLIQEIRKNGRNWQEVFEQWVLLGEEDVHWQQYKDSTVDSDTEQEEQSFKLDLKPELVKQILKYAESMDVNKLQEQVQQFSKTISTVQEVVSQYQTTRKPKGIERPFNWFHD